MPFKVMEVARETLYEQVWSAPLHTVCTQYWVSTTALSGICELHGIPVPPQGYWARRAHGYQDPRPPLPPLPDGQSDNVEIVALYRKRPPHAHHEGEPARMSQSVVRTLPADTPPTSVAPVADDAQIQQLAERLIDAVRLQLQTQPRRPLAPVDDDVDVCSVY
jgi:hypothetical protein